MRSTSTSNVKPPWTRALTNHFGRYHPEMSLPFCLASGLGHEANRPVGSDPEHRTILSGCRTVLLATRGTDNTKDEA
jgi:hypothetical protein